MFWYVATCRVYFVSISILKSCVFGVLCTYIYISKQFASTPIVNILLLTAYPSVIRSNQWQILLLKWFLRDVSCCSRIKAYLYFSLSILCYHCSDGVYITMPAGCQWFLKQSSKAPSNLQSLASVLPQASPVMGLVAHDPRHVSSYV